MAVESWRRRGPWHQGGSRLATVQSHLAVLDRLGLVLRLDVLVQNVPAREANIRRGGPRGP